MHKDRLVAVAFTLWAVLVTGAFLQANGAYLFGKLLERLGR
ncbi:hypothetical protein [Magnetospirillum sulfuroxidans]|nr:hypothetical protein [Magnetospirillum sulfuroxidans]